MITYRTHTCGELNKSHKDKEVILSGWIHKKRDHGNLLFYRFERQLWHQSVCD